MIGSVCNSQTISTLSTRHHCLHTLTSAASDRYSSLACASGRPHWDTHCSALPRITAVNMAARRGCLQQQEQQQLQECWQRAIKDMKPRDNPCVLSCVGGYGRLALRVPYNVLRTSGRIRTSQVALEAAPRLRSTHHRGSEAQTDAPQSARQPKRVVQRQRERESSQPLIAARIDLTLVLGPTPIPYLRGQRSRERFGRCRRRCLGHSRNGMDQDVAHTLTL